MTPAHTLKARVLVGGRMSDPFDVLVGVKQGLCPGSSHLNLFLVAFTLASQDGIPPDAGAVPFIYHMDGSLFNIRWLNADTKISRRRIFELMMPP